MKKPDLKIISTLLCMVLLVLSVIGTYNVLRWKDTEGEYIDSVEQLYNTADNLTDVVFLGSSHVYCGIYPAVMWELKGIAAFDMAVSGQDKGGTYHTLVELLKTQSPKAVFVDLYQTVYDNGIIDGNIYRNYLSLRPSANSVKQVKNYLLKEDKTSFYVRWPIIHTRYRELGPYDFYDNEINDYARGAYYDNFQSHTCSEININEVASTPIEDKNLCWINDIIELSERYDFELNFMVVPFFMDDGTKAVIGGVKDYVKACGYPVYDFNESYRQIGINCNEDFCDETHLNGVGAAKLTTYISEVILKDYPLPDRRGDSAYYQWEEDYKLYLHNRDLICSRDSFESIEEYAEYVKGLVDCSIIVSIEGEVSDEAYSFAQILGIGSAETAQGGKWLYRNGELTKLIGGNKGEQKLLKVGDFDTFYFRNIEQGSQYNIMFNKTPLNLTEPEILLLFYDDVLKKITFESIVY